MTTALATRNGTGATLPRPPMPTALITTLQEAVQLGELLAKTNYFKDVRDAGQAVAKILYGHELGIGPMASMMGIHIIEGKPSPSAGLIATLIKRSRRYNYRLVTWTPQECAIEFYEWGQPCGVVQFTIADAQRAELASKAIWKKYPEAMLFSRAIAMGARAYCADVFGGAPVYTAEELDAPVDVEAVMGELPLTPTVDTATGEVIDVEWEDAPTNGHAPLVPWTPTARQTTEQTQAAVGESVTHAASTAALWGRVNATFPALGLADKQAAVRWIDTELGKSFKTATPDELERAVEAMEAFARETQRTA